MSTSSSLYAAFAFVLVLTCNLAPVRACTELSGAAASDCCLEFVAGPQAEATNSGDPLRQPDPSSEPTPSVAPELIESLIAWVGAHSNYDVSKALSNPPTVDFCRRGTIVDYEGEDLIVERPLVAFYDIKKRHIFLVEPWDPENSAQVSTLLHELTHDVQHLNKDWPCWGKAEWEAYKLQESWLLEQGQTPAFNWSDIFLQSLCPRDIHP